MISRNLHIMLCTLVILLLSSISFAKNTSGLKIALIVDSAGVNDKSFNEAIYRGLGKARGSHQNVSIKTVVSNNYMDYTPFIDNLVQEQYNIILTAGFNMLTSTYEAARKYPNVKFIIVDGTYDKYPANLASLNFDEYQAGYLVGIFAGGLSSSSNNTIKGIKLNKRIGVIKGMDIPPINSYAKGFADGVKQTCKDCSILSSVVGDFTDITKAKKLADSMYQEGIGIIFPIAGLTSTSVIESAKQHERYVIGIDIDQNYLGSNVVLTSALKNTEEIINETVNEIIDDKFEFGRVHNFDIKLNGIGVASYHSFDKKIPRDVKDLVDKAKNDLLTDKIKKNHNAIATMK